MTLLLFFLTAYLLGSIPSGYLIARWVRGIDIRQHGSRNIGATNVFRVVGKKWGVYVFILDGLKGYAGVRLPELFGFSLPGPFLIGLGIVSILGHTYTLWLSFKGGKGVATSFGVFLAICPRPTLLSFGIFCLIFGMGRILSLGSLAAAASFPFMVTLTHFRNPEFAWFLGVSLALSAFIFYTHRKNLERLFRGKEKKLF